MRTRRWAEMGAAALALLALLTGSYEFLYRPPLNRELAAALEKVLRAFPPDPGPVRRLIHRGADVRTRGKSGSSALLVAAAAGDLEFVRELLERGAEVNAPSGGWASSLGAAAAMGHLEVVKVLIAAGANVNARTKTAGPLGSAAWNGHTEVVRALLAAGADVNAGHAKVGPPHNRSPSGPPRKLKGAHCSRR